MRIAIVTDAWSPQVNGVVRTLTATRVELERQGHEVVVVSPDLYLNLPCPTYPEIRLAVATSTSVGDCSLHSHRMRSIFRPRGLYAWLRGDGSCGRARRLRLPFIPSFPIISLRVRVSMPDGCGPISAGSMRRRVPCWFRRRRCDRCSEITASIIVFRGAGVSISTHFRPPRRRTVPLRACSARFSFMWGVSR